MTREQHQSWSEDVAAYVLGALDPAELAEFEGHLAGCERCREEIRWFTPAVVGLPEAVERLAPPPRLRERLMDEVRADADAATPPRSAERGARGWLGRLIPGSGSRGWQPLAGLAALALVLVAFAGYEIGNGGGGGGGTSTIVSGHGPGVTAKVVRKGDSAELNLANVAPLPADRVLEAWVQREGEVEPVRALFVPDREGNASTMIADMTDVEVVMVTSEPSGGSEAPTSSPIATVPIPQ